MLGAVSPESFDTLHSYSNTFQMPFVTPLFPEKVCPKRFQINYNAKIEDEIYGSGQTGERNEIVAILIRYTLVKSIFEYVCMHPYVPCIYFAIMQPKIARFVNLNSVARVSEGIFRTLARKSLANYEKIQDLKEI